MRSWPLLLSILMFGAPSPTLGQGVVVQGAAGPTLVDRGYSAAVGAGWAPWSRLLLSANLERTRLFSRVTGDGRGSSSFRGGTVTLGTGELSLALFARNRVTPYVLAGIAAGVSRPTVNAAFPVPVRNDVRAVFGGAGIHVPLGPRVGLFADARMMLGDEGDELLAIAPLRLGVSWRF